MRRYGYKEEKKQQRKKKTKIKRSCEEVKEYGAGGGSCVNQTVTRKTADLLSSGSTGRFSRDGPTYNFREIKRERQAEKVEGKSGEKRERERDSPRNRPKGWGQGGSWIESLCLLGGDHRP